MVTITLTVETPEVTTLARAQALRKAFEDSYYAVLLGHTLSGGDLDTDIGSSFSVKVEQS